MFKRCVGLATLLTVLVSGSRMGRQCQFFYNTELGYSLAIGSCNYYVSALGQDQSSFKYECSEDGSSVNMYTYSTFDCRGFRQTTTYTLANADFNCDASRLHCGIPYGYRSPCECSVEDGSCDSAVEFSIVPNICLKLLYNTTGSFEWDFTCKRSTKQADKIAYSTPDCTGTPRASSVFPGGCFSNERYVNEYGNEELEWVICPGNMATWSLSLFAMLIAALLF